MVSVEIKILDAWKVQILYSTLENIEREEHESIRKTTACHDLFKDGNYS